MTSMWFNDVLEFVRLSGRHISSTPNVAFPDKELRLRLIDEEYRELNNAVDRQDLLETADAIVDLIYVLCGAAISWGLDIREVWEEVQAANMRKFPDGKPLMVDGKITKPPGWVGPDVSAALARGWIEQWPYWLVKSRQYGRGTAGLDDGVLRIEDFEYAHQQASGANLKPSVDALSAPWFQNARPMLEQHFQECAEYQIYDMKEGVVAKRVEFTKLFSYRHEYQLGSSELFSTVFQCSRCGRVLRYMHSPRFRGDQG